MTESSLFAVDDALIGEDDQEHFDEEFEEENEEEGGVVIVMDAKKKKRRVAAPRSKEDVSRARGIHHAFLMSCCAHVVYLDRMADDEETQAKALSVAPNVSEIKVGKMLKRVWDHYDDDTVANRVIQCLAFARVATGRKCRVLCATPFVSWKPEKPKQQQQQQKPDEEEDDEDEDDDGKKKKKKRTVSRKKKKKDDVDDDVDDVDEAVCHYALQLWVENSWKIFYMYDDARSRFEDESHDPISYVFGAVSGYVREIAALFSQQWSKTVKKYRYNEKQLREAMERINRSCPSPPPWLLEADSADSAVMTDKIVSEPLPKSISSFKCHPCFVLESQLGNYHHVRHGAKVLGQFDGKNIYSRLDMIEVHTMDKWLEMAKVPRRGERPIKVIKSSKKEDEEKALWAPHQMEDYEPGEAVDGIVPKNEHGNVYLYQAKMMPRGCCLANATLKTAKQLGIDCARAVIGWTWKRAGSYPQYSEQIVVCNEFKETLEMAQAEYEVVKAEKDEKKERTRGIKNWKRLVRRAIVFRRLGSVFKE